MVRAIVYLIAQYWPLGLKKKLGEGGENVLLEILNKCFVHKLGGLLAEKNISEGVWPHLVPTNKYITDTATWCSILSHHPKRPHILIGERIGCVTREIEADMWESGDGGAGRRRERGFRKFYV